ncbi:unnamed protein product [Paramecium sonneborni]|uniref:Uncharacterized protein n=1 Tax=Paramecium sonneborni TaxID=65129 RepID=A0A8S1PZM0_9CILI|nr:unnamed protein product [Paramecium sonneborni]
MIFSNQSQSCNDHLNQQIGGINIGQNQKQRKICMECIQKKKINLTQFLLLKDFVEKVLQKSNSLNIKHQLEQSQSKEIFKQSLQLLDKIQEEIILIITSIKESIQAIQVHEKNIDHKFIQLIHPNLNPVECSDSELDFLVNFINGDIFEKEMEKRIQLSQFIKNNWFQEEMVNNLYKFCHLIENIEKKFIQQTEQTSISFEVLENDNKKLKFNSIQNLEQAKHLQVEGQYGVKGNRIRKWKYFWKGQEIGYCQYNIWGQQDGNQIELCDNYSDKKNVLEIGQCSKGKRCGKWSFYCGYRQIGGGSYNEEGIKTGKWVELDSQFKLERQIIYQGEYNMKGLKIGKWNIEYCNPGQEEYKKIGGGLYDQENQIKNGQWIELWDNFEKYTQVISYGKYSQEGIKVDKWDFQYRQYNEQKYRQMQMVMDLIIKRELKYRVGYSQMMGLTGKNKSFIKVIIMQEGQKLVNGIFTFVIQEKKYRIKLVVDPMINREQRMGCGQNCGKDFVSRLRSLRMVDIIRKVLRQIDGIFVIVLKITKIMNQCGGFYDSEGIKTGKWVELDEHFFWEKQIIYEGQYNWKGMKIGQWDSKYCSFYDKEYKLVGGGSYNQKGVKAGKWEELDDGFDECQQVIQIGLYNNEGFKIGLWEYRDIEEKKKIGENNYDN